MKKKAALITIEAGKTMAHLEKCKQFPLLEKHIEVRGSEGWRETRITMNLDSK